jgi:hypothetical protein
MTYMTTITTTTKPADQSKLYRPISLFSPVVKVLEWLIKPHLDKALPHANKQHGYAPASSTVSALHPLISKVVGGFNEGKPPVRTAVVAVNISKAFDSVDHTLLLDMVAKSTLRSNLVRWLAAYLRGCMASCHYQDFKAPLKNIHSGIPQGSVKSPTLFNYLVSDFPNVVELTFSYADNFTIAEPSSDISLLRPKLTEDFEIITAWAKGKKLSIEPSKSQVILFSSDPHQANYHPQVFINSGLVPLNKQLRILGIDHNRSACYNNQFGSTLARLRVPGASLSSKPLGARVLSRKLCF